MSDMGRAAGALVSVVAFAAATVAGANWARANGYMPAPADDGAAVQAETAGQTRRTAATPYDLFITGDHQSAVQLDQINALCGFSGPIGPEETRLAIVGEDPGALLMHYTSGGAFPAVYRHSAPADQLHAASSEGELVIMVAEGRFNARVFVLDERGEPLNSDPLEQNAEWYGLCANPVAAAAALNSLFAERGARFDPVQAALEQFADQFAGGAVSELATACGVTDISTAVSGHWILGASVRRQRSWAGISHPETGDWIRGVDDFLDLDIARRWDDGAMISRYALPLSEAAAYGPTANGFGPTLNWNAIAVRHFQIWADGSRAHSEPGDPVRQIDIPCRDIAAGEAAIRAMR